MNDKQQMVVKMVVELNSKMMKVLVGGCADEGSISRN